MVVGLYGVSLCLLMPSVLCIGGFGELGELFLNATGEEILIKLVYTRCTHYAHTKVSYNVFCVVW